MSGYVYFIAAETIGAVKIGFTRGHPRARLKALQTGCPASLKLLAFVHATPKEERLLHEAFAPLHMHGEWFRFELKLRSLVRYLDGQPGGAVTRKDFRETVSDVLFFARDFNVFEPSATTQEYVSSAVAEPLGEIL